MRRGKILSALVLCVLVLGFLLPRPTPVFSATGGEDRIAASAGQDGTIVSPRPPRRRAERPPVALPVQALPTSPAVFSLQDAGRMSAVPVPIPIPIQPSSGAGVTRAGPSILV